jgi:hypothetical protein
MLFTKVMLPNSKISYLEEQNILQLVEAISTNSTISYLEEQKTLLMDYVMNQQHYFYLEEQKTLLLAEAAGGSIQEGVISSAHRDPV